jgi:hypothetical protein
MVPYIEPLTYVWYQFRFTMMTKGLVDAAGPNVLRPLWDRSPFRTSSSLACSAAGSIRRQASG